MASRLDLLLYAICLMHLSATASTLGKMSVTLPDNCKEPARGIVSCQHSFPKFSSYDPVLLERIKALQIKDCDSPILGKDSFVGLDNLVILRLECDLVAVKLGAFDGLTNLKYLFLHGQDSIVLPDRLFCDLPSLAVLSLTNGSFAANTTMGFHSKCVDDKNSCGVNISTIYIEDNDLTKISYELLCNFPNLQVFNASNNQINSISSTAFSRAFHLEKLYLANNSMLFLSPYIFQNTAKLTLLDLSLNKLSTIPTGLFKGLAKLQNLNLRGNMLEVIPQTAFVDLSNLSELDLSNNLLTVLGTSLGTLKNLNTLYLSGNKLTEITSTNFIGLPHLSHLKLDNNSITVFDEEALKFNDMLVMLSINNNKLSSLPNFEYTKLLVTLNVANNSFTALGQTAFQTCEHVFMLDFSGNKIQSINNQTFANMTFLLLLDLSNNGLKSIEKGSFDHLDSLKVLSLQNNQLTFEENIYEGEHMDLFNPLESMQLLNLSSNRISAISYSWFPSHLIYISLANNLISNLPFYSNYLHPTPHLHIMDLSNNHIQDVFASQFPPSLTHVILNMNKIKSIAPNAFQDLLSLEMIILSENSLQVMPPLSLGSGFTMVKLRDNPWLCDCRQNWMKDVKNLPFAVIDYRTTKCQILFNKAQRESTMNVSDVTPDQFLCTFARDPNNANNCVSSSDRKSCLHQCPTSCTCYHDITWEIVKIDCSSARLKKVPEDAPKVTSTYYLDGNSINTVESTALQNAESLKEIYLNSSKILLIEDGTFKFTLNLEVLHLDNNLLETLPDSLFLNLTKLKYLDLSTNHLQSLQETIFTPLTSLQTLNLQNNKLTNFPVWSFSANPAITAMSLYNNPWSCECTYAQKYREWLLTHLDKLRNITRLHCFLDTPVGPQNVSLTLFNATHCYHNIVAAHADIPGSNTTVIIIGICVPIMILVVVVMAIVFRKVLKMRIEQKFGVRLY